MSGGEVSATYVRKPFASRFSMRLSHQGTMLEGHLEKLGTQQDLESLPKLEKLYNFLQSFSFDMG